MDEDPNSLIRRVKYLHTVCHRFDPSRLVSSPVRIRPSEISRLKSCPEMTALDKRSELDCRKVEHSCLSPTPETDVSDTFKEARCHRKNFFTPVLRRKELGKETGEYVSKDSRDVRPVDVKLTPNASPLRIFSPLRVFVKLKPKRDSAWTKYFDHGGGKVTAIGAVEEFMVDLSQLFLGLRFAHGAHSRLYHGTYKGEPVAVKITRVPDDDENGSLAARLENQFNKEVTLLSHLNHPNVLRFIAAYRQPPVYCVVTEYLPEGSLRAYLHKLEHETLPFQKLIPVALDIARGMEYTHSRGIIHRDLKPENVLIDEAFHMKIADFGIACEELCCDPFADDPGTYRWMAPEMIKHKSYGRKVDVYSFGLILWEMVSGSIPYEDMTPIQAAFAVVNKNLRPVFPKDCPPPMRALIEQCWSLQPDKRPEFWQVVKVLEQFESSLVLDGSLKMVQTSICQDKKGFLHWIHKLGPPLTKSKSMTKPK